MGTIANAKFTHNYNCYNGYFSGCLLLSAMTCVECGISLHDVDMESICRGYRLAFPENNEKLSKLLDTLDEYSEWG